ncbi:MAG: glycosyltransferase [Armatimonadetes bacterium]|nr:glycosyltransferase [Armatimonadota bacterium]
MKILFLSAWFPYPPDNGARIRAYNLIKGLAQENEVYLISLLQEDSNEENSRYLDNICEVVSLHNSHWFKPGGIKSLLGLFSSAPRSVVCTYDSRVTQAVLGAIDRIRPDVLIVSSLGMAHYVPGNLSVPSILDQHNCEYAVMKRAADKLPNGWNRWRAAAGWKKSARWEARMCKKFDVVTAVSEQDRQLMLQAAPNLLNLHILPNGVDTALYQPEQWSPEPKTLIYNGALTYSANLDAIKYYITDIYPHLADTGITLRVTGRHSGIDLQGVEKCPGVELIGYVDDIRDVLKKSAACVVPLREGGGSRLKILEAMAAGVPVISTAMGSEGIEATPGTHIITADSPKDFALAIKRVLGDQSLARSLSSNARLFVEQRYDWSTISTRLYDIANSLVGSARTHNRA